MIKALTKRSTPVLLLILFLFSSFAMDGDRLVWGPKLPKNGVVVMIGEYDGVLYSLRTSWYKVYLEKSNAETLARISSEEIPSELSEDKEEIRAAMGHINDGNIILLGATRKDTLTTFYGRIINLKDNSTSAWTPLIKGGQSLVYDLVFYKQSPDKNLFVIGLSFSNAQTNTHTYSLVVADNKLNKKWEKNFSFSSTENQMHIEDLHIDNLGRAYLLANYASSFKEFTRQVLNQEQSSGMMVYASYDGTSENFFTREIAIESGKIYGAKLGLDTANGDVLLCGLYSTSEDKINGLSGLFHTRFKMGTTLADLILTPIEETWVKELVQGRNPKLFRRDYSSFSVDKLISTPDGGFLCVGECLNQQLDMAGPEAKTQTYGHRSNSIFLIKFEPNNSIEYSKIIARKGDASTRHNNVGHSFLAIPRASHVDILFVDNPKNTDVDGNRKAFKKLKSAAVKRVTMVWSKVDFDGTITHTMLDKAKFKHMSPTYVWNTLSKTENLYISGSALQGVKVNTFIGKINLKD